MPKSHQCYLFEGKIVSVILQCSNHDIIGVMAILSDNTNPMNLPTSNTTAINFINCTCTLLKMVNSMVYTVHSSLLFYKKAQHSWRI